MSKIAKAPVVYSSNVEITIAEGSITVKGPKGTLTEKINQLVTITKSKDSNQLEFKPSVQDNTNAWAQAGTARALVNNMVIGVTEGFVKTLELVGVGYRAQTKGNALVLSLGYSHPIEHALPNTVSAEVPSNTTIVLKSINKQILGQVASEIRAYRPPEPYKGKGIKYLGEQIARKEPKKK